MAEIVPVVSEALEARIRDLLPSQRGFGQDLQASNVITPIIDLTAAAQGTTTPEILQTALAFGSQTVFAANNSTGVVANTPGFYRVVGVSLVNGSSAGFRNNEIRMSDGLSNKTVWSHTQTGTGTVGATAVNIDLVVFLRSGDTVSVISNAAEAYISGSSRQIADVNGNLVNPVGFTPQ